MKCVVRLFMAYAAIATAVAVALCVSPLAAGASAPPGASAKCRDGSYSFSQHHSGTCSHHGGVAVWLDASTSTTTGTSVTPSPAAPTSVGVTVLLAKRTKTSGCKLGPNPDSR